MKGSNQSKEVDVQDFMEMMDVADAIARQKKEVERELNHDELVKDLHARLKQAYEAMGKDLDDAHIQEAISNYFSSRYEFQSPAKGVGLTLASLYVDRSRIARTYVAPPTIAIALGVTGYGAWTGGGYLVRQAAEGNVEQATEQAYSESLHLAKALNELSSNPFLSSLPSSDADLVSRTLATGSVRLTNLNDFFARYCPEGEADNAVTQQNYKEAGAELELVEFALKDVGSDAKKLGDIVKREKRFAEYPAIFGQLYSRINEAALESRAKEENERLYGMHKAFISTRDAKGLEDTLSSLKSLEEAVTREYDIVITGGKWRYPNDNPSVKNYYLLVKAMPKNGSPLRMNIRNEEDGQNYLVDEWGEHVPQEIYEQVKEDKTDDGIIQQNLFGKKRNGYLTEEVTITLDGKPINKKGQITRW